MLRMGLIVDVFYFLALLFAAPVLIIKSARTGKYRSGWAGRFGIGEDVFPKRAKDAKLLLLHCVSVGELLSTQTLVERLLAADPRVLIAITTTTDTGTARAQTMYPSNPDDPKHNPRVATLRFPLDFSFAVESLFDRVRPDAVALVELETWPMFLAIAQSRRVPVVIVNGRLSERSFPRYALIRPVMAAMLDKVAWLGVQTQTILERFISLGASPDRVSIIPTLKYDTASFADTVPGQEMLAQAMGLTAEHLLFVGGSTGPGEETALLDAYLALREQYPELRLAIAPRKPETVPQVIEAIRTRHLTPLLRTDHPDDPLSTKHLALSTSSVFLLNTLGELKKLYALAFAVFVGRSLINLGGSDMIEVAALGKACCFGPYTANFAEVVELLVRENAAVKVTDGQKLRETLAGWLADPAIARKMGRLAREAITAQRGSTDQYAERLLGLLSLFSPSRVQQSQ
jgi:3-deoxy-D-manno-octulosonic-acid transferase